VRKDGLVQVERTAQVDGNDLVPEIGLGLQERPGDVPSRVVDEDIDLPELRRALLDSAPDGFVAGDVGDNRENVATLRAQLFREVVQRRGVDIRGNDPDALFDEARADGAANSTGRSSDDRNAAPQTFDILSPS
jgi:hypothetical protein